MSNPLACGIDFGTSNSTCALTDASGTHLIALEGTHITLPSAIFFSKDAPLFGREAISAYIDGEEGRLMRSLKSVLGTTLMDERTILAQGSKSFVDILSVYIRHLKSAAEASASQDIENVVFGRPVHFHDDNPAADQKSQDTLEQIARAVGFKNIAFQYEPIAAAFAHEQNIESERLSLVVDLGGGTSDFTVIRLSRKKSTHSIDRSNDILATGGIRVGGTNFDQRLSMASFMPSLGLGSSYVGEFDGDRVFTVPSLVYNNLSDWTKVHQAQTAKAVSDTKAILRKALDPERIVLLLAIQERQLGHAVLQKVEKTKISLTHAAEAEITLPDKLSNQSIVVNKAEFETSIAELIARISLSLNAILRQSGITKDQIELVILTGGSTELPIINQMIAQEFPHAQIERKNKFGSVGLGLAHHAGRIF